MKNSNSEMLASAPVGKLLFKLAVPTVTAQIINMLYNIVDRIYIGHIPEVGAQALTGVGVCMPLIMLVSAFAALVGCGGAPRASIFMGKSDKESALRTLANCFTLQLIISAVLTAVLLCFNKELLLAFGASENTIDYALEYMNIYSAGTVFVQLTLGMNMFITAQGFAKTGMLSVIIGAAANIILDPVFIFAFDMGVKGAAVATVISQALSCIWIISFLCSSKSELRLSAKYMPLRKNIILPAVALGMSHFVMQSSESIVSVCFNASLLGYGGDTAVGAMTILTSVMQFAMLPLNGLGQGAQPIISFNFGAQNAKRIKSTFKLLIISSLCYASLLWGAIMLFPNLFVAMFTFEQTLIEYTIPALRIYMGCAVLFGIQCACQATFVAIGNAKASITVAVVRKFVLLLPLIFIMPHIYTADKAMAVYMAEPVADFFAVTFTAILFSILFKKTLKSINREEKDEKC